MTRRAYVDHRRRVCFFWSPKCASRSLSHWLFRTYVQQGDRAELNHGRLTYSLFEYDFATSAMLAMNSGYLAVAMIRHPATRIVSAYVNKFVLRRDTPLTRFRQLESFSQEVAREIARSQNRPPPEERWDGISLFDLLDYVAERTSLQGEAPRLNQHWSPQVAPERRLVGLRFDHVCAVESLAEDFEPIRRLYRSELPISTQNRTEHAAAPASNDRTSVPSTVLATTALDPWSLLTDEALDRIAHIYARDFAVLGYDPRDLDRPPSIRARNKATLRHPSQRELAAEWLRWRRTLSSLHVRLPAWASRAALRGSRLLPTRPTYSLALAALKRARLPAAKARRKANGAGRTIPK